MLLAAGALASAILGATADAWPCAALMAKMPKTQRPPAIALPIIFELDMRPISKLVICFVHCSGKTVHCLVLIFFVGREIDLGKIPYHPLQFRESAAKFVKRSYPVGNRLNSPGSALILIVGASTSPVLRSPQIRLYRIC